MCTSLLPFMVLPSLVGTFKKNIREGLLTTVYKHVYSEVFPKKFTVDVSRFSALLIHGFVKPARACLTAVQVQLSIGHKNVIGLRERLGMRSQAQRYLWLSLLVVQTLDIHLGSQVTAGRSDHVVC